MSDASDGFTASRSRRSDTRERGFTMIELLVVCIVTAIISAISIPVFLRHRANAKEDSVASDARQAGLALSAQVTGAGMIPSSVNAQGGGIWNFKPTSPNTVVEYKAQDTRFRICIANTLASPRAWAYFESVTNKVTSGTGTEPTGACDGNTAGPALPVETVRGPSTPIPTPPVATEVALAVGEKCHTFTAAPGATGYKSLSWSAVSGATAYRVKEYRNGTLINNTLVTGTTHQAANTAPDTWQYTVDARGEGFTGPCAAPTYTPPADVAPGTPAAASASTVPGESSVSLNWGSVANATTYLVYIDGASTPSWTGTATNAVVTGLNTGSHTVAVSAKTGTAEGSKSPTTTFSVTNNDAYAAAEPLTPPAYHGNEALTIDFSNATATVQAGEPTTAGGGAVTRSLWFYFTAPSAQNYTLKTLAPNSGAGITSDGMVSVWKVAAAPSASNPTLPSTTPALYSEDSSPPATTASGAANETAIATTSGGIYAVRVSMVNSSATGRFRLVIKRAYNNDSVAAPDAMSNVFGTGTVTQATTDPSRNTADTAGTSLPHTEWYTYRAAANGFLCVWNRDAVANTPVTHTSLAAWGTTASTVTGLGSTIATGTGWMAVPITNGTTYTVRIGTRLGSGVSPYKVAYKQAAASTSCTA